jgi:SAM-dependent methyltransferase
MNLTMVKQRQQAAWASGDYAEVGARNLVVSELLCDAVDLRAGERVLDVACGNGNAALAAARRFCQVVGVDYVPSLLERARQRAAAELLRVCRPGGRIGMVNWVPDGYVAALFRAIGRHLPPPPGLRPPVEWGDEQRLRELFGPEVTIVAPRKTFLWRFPSAEHQAEFFATFYGPTNRALATLGADRAAELKADMVEVARSFDDSDDDTLVLRQEYLEAVIYKPAAR